LLDCTFAERRDGVVLSHPPSRLVCYPKGGAYFRVTGYVILAVLSGLSYGLLKWIKRDDQSTGATIDLVYAVFGCVWVVFI
jgi:hypothetical protein